MADPDIQIRGGGLGGGGGFGPQFGLKIREGGVALLLDPPLISDVNETSLSE